MAALAMLFLCVDAATELVALVHLLLHPLGLVGLVLGQRALLLVAHGVLLPWSRQLVPARVSPR